MLKMTLQKKLLVKLTMKQDENKQFFSRQNLQTIENLINRFIAPWRFKKELPKFGYKIPVHRMFIVIEKVLKKKGMNLNSFQIFCFTHKEEHYSIKDHSKEEYIIPKQANILFVPATEHLLHMDFENTEISTQFGIDEMKLDDTFIISNNDK